MNNKYHVIFAIFVLLVIIAVTGCSTTPTSPTITNPGAMVNSSIAPTITPHIESNGSFNAFLYLYRAGKLHWYEYNFTRYIGQYSVPNYANYGTDNYGIIKTVLNIVSYGGVRNVWNWNNTFIQNVVDRTTNNICMKAGFTLQGAVVFEYPPGRFMRCNDWYLDIFPLNSGTG